MDMFTTSAGLVTVTQAHTRDLEEVLAILTRAGEWLAKRGIDQWGPSRFSRKGSSAAIERGEVYVARIGSKSVGTLRLQWSDEALWGARPDDAGYIHALAVERLYARQQIGLGLLRWAEHQVASADRKLLRLDCTAANPALRNYYLKSGFVFVSELQKSGWTAALFEREAKLIEEILT